MVGAGDVTQAEPHRVTVQAIQSVAPSAVTLMCGELAAAVASVVLVDPAFPRAWTWLGVALAAAARLLTLTLSVPQHNVLAGGFDERAHAILVGTNWLRTCVWTARGALLLWVVSRAFAAAP